MTKKWKRRLPESKNETNILDGRFLKNLHSMHWTLCCKWIFNMFLLDSFSFQLYMDLRNCNIKIDFPHVYFKLFYNFHKKNYPMRIQIIIYCRNYNHSHICVGAYVKWGTVPLNTRVGVWSLLGPLKLIKMQFIYVFIKL